MPTIPPERARLRRPEPHQHRQVAESFGSDAERYDRARPGYPGALVERIVAASPGLDVLDVGCGTGIAARQFQAAGCRVMGVDPDARMAGLARRSGTEVEVVTFEAWDPAGREFDAVIAGQAWHWVDPVAGAAKAALALRPGGRLAVFWNAFQPPPDLAEAFARAYDRVQTGLPFNPWARPALDSYLRPTAEAQLRDLDRAAPEPVRPHPADPPETLTLRPDWVPARIRCGRIIACSAHLGTLTTVLFAVEEIEVAPEATSTGVMVVRVSPSPTCPT